MYFFFSHFQITTVICVLGIIISLLFKLYKLPCFVFCVFVSVYFVCSVLFLFYPSSFVTGLCAVKSARK
jgi:hypothetical protein